MKLAIRVPAVMLALTLLLAPLAAGQQGQITVPRFSHVTVLTLDLHQSDFIDYSWTANSSVIFRISNTTGGQNFLSIAGQTGSGSWQANANGNYTFDFRNQNSPAAAIQWNIALRPVLAATYAYLLVAVAIAAFAIIIFSILKKKPEH